MNVRFVRHFVGGFALVLLASSLVACGSSPATSAVATPGATVTAPSLTATSTQSSTLTPTSSPATAATSTIGGAFTPFTGPGFTVEYPTSWQKSQQKINTGKTVYSFEYSDNITGFHVEMHSTYFDASSPVNDLLGAQLSCNPGDTSLPQTVTVNGALWNQSDMLCMLASTYYEVRLLTNTNPTTKDQTTIVYGAYQQATASPPFAQANQKYFEPMLQSFKFV